MIIGFQIVWFGFAWGISHHYPLLPILLSLIYLNTYISKQPDKKVAYLFLGKVLLLGFIADSVIGLLGLMTYASPYPQPFQWLQPWWLSLVWLCFAASAKVSFSWLEQRRPLAVILGLIGGPVAYLSGEKFGVFLDIQNFGFVLIAISWGGIMWLLIKQLPSIPDHLQYKS